MLISQLDIGHVFEYMPVIGGEGELGIKLSSDTELISCILDIDYCIMDSNFVVNQLCSISNLTIDEKDFVKTNIKLSGLAIGEVFQVSGLYGLLSTYCKTRFKVFGGIICAALTTPTQMIPNIDVNDLGFAYDYNGLPDEGLRRIDLSSIKE